MSKINLTIDTDDLMPDVHYDPDGGPEVSPGAPFQALVIEAVARQILRADSFARDVRVAVQERIDGEVSKQVEGLVQAVIAEPIQRTTAWGERKGDPTTVREIIREHVEAWFSEKPRRDAFGSRDKKSLDSIIQESTRSVMDQELKTEVDRVRKEVSAQLRDKALKAAVDAISPRER